jgi:hypothetical protein
MAEAGVTFDADGNLVVTTIIPPSEFPTAQIPPNIAQAITDAKQAETDAAATESDITKVEADLQPEATPTPADGGTTPEPTPAAESPPT